MNKFKWLNELKLRASYGTIGNILSIDTYGTTSTLTQWNSIMNEQPVPDVANDALLYPDYQEAPDIQENIFYQKYDQQAQAKPFQPLGFGIAADYLYKSLLIEIQKLGVVDGP